MKQSVFVQINKSKWQDYETKLTLDRTSAEELSKMYVHLTEDLAFAKAKYPRTKLTAYLNKLSLQIHNHIYKNKPESKSRLITFWKHEVPFIMRSSGKPMLYAFLMLTFGVFIGVLSATYDQTFVRLILGDGYVDMTIRNIESGNPMGVYGKMDQVPMFFYITINNIRVSFIAFVFGIFTSLGVGFVLIRNGIMLGAFHYFFYQYGLFDSTMLTIWLHGTIEITSIVIAGGAGIILGNGWAFPGTYTRMHSFARSARRGLKIIIGLIPFFIIAGFIESFVTRYSDMPLLLKLIIILGSVFLLIYYFIYLPYKTPKHVTVEN